MQLSEKLEEGIRSLWQGTFNRWTREVQKWITPYASDNNDESAKEDKLESNEKEKENRVKLLGVNSAYNIGDLNNKLGNLEIASSSHSSSDNIPICDVSELEIDTMLDSLEFDNDEEKELLRSKLAMINEVFHDELEELRKQHRRLRAEQMLKLYLNTASKEEDTSESMFEYFFRALTNRNNNFRIDSRVCRKIVEELLLMDELERVLVSLEKQSLELDNLISDLELEVHDRILSSCKPKMKGLSSSVDSFTKRMHEEGGLKYIDKDEKEILLAYASLPPPLTRENIAMLCKLRSKTTEVGRRSGQKKIVTFDDNVKQQESLCTTEETIWKNPTCNFLDLSEGEYCARHSSCVQKEESYDELKQEVSCTDIDCKCFSERLSASEDSLKESCDSLKADVDIFNDSSTLLDVCEQRQNRSLLNKQPTGHFKAQEVGEMIDMGKEDEGNDLFSKPKLIFMRDRDSGISLTVDESSFEASSPSYDREQTFDLVVNQTECKREQELDTSDVSENIVSDLKIATGMGNTAEMQRMVQSERHISTDNVCMQNHPERVTRSVQTEKQKHDMSGDTFARDISAGTSDSTMKGEGVDNSNGRSKQDSRDTESNGVSGFQDISAMHYSKDYETERLNSIKNMLGRQEATAQDLQAERRPLI